MFQVDAGGGAIILAHAHDRVRPAGSLEIVGQRIWVKKVSTFGFARGVCGKPRLGRRVDQYLGEWVWLREPEPMIVAERERHVGPLEMLDGRDDVEYGQPNHAPRMVERKPMRNAPSPVMAYNVKPLMPEVAHDRDHVCSHHFFCIGRVIGCGWRLE
jgi:hypothetical protein